MSTWDDHWSPAEDCADGHPQHDCGCGHGHQDRSGGSSGSKDDGSGSGSGHHGHHHHHWHRRQRLIRVDQVTVDCRPVVFRTPGQALNFVRFRRFPFGIAPTIPF